MEIFLGRLRQERGLSLSQLAKVSGVSKTHINDIENGSTHPTIPAMCKLAAALEVPCNELFDCGNTILGRKV